MSSEAIISVENLASCPERDPARRGKMYRLRTGGLRDQRYVALRDVLVEKATGLFRRNGGRRGQRDNETTGQQDQSPEVSDQPPAQSGLPSGLYALRAGSGRGGWSCGHDLRGAGSRGSGSQGKTVDR
jgi:hypothetical protein